jgi:hypothetical protein
MFTRPGIINDGFSSQPYFPTLGGQCHHLSRGVCPVFEAVFVLFLWGWHQLETRCSTAAVAGDEFTLFLGVLLNSYPSVLKKNMFDMENG